MTLTSFYRTMADSQAEGSTPPSEEQKKALKQDAEAQAKAKGKQIVVEEEDIDVMNLSPSDFGKPLDLKVYRKWISKNIPDPTPTGICFMLLDKKVHLHPISKHTQ